VLPSIQQKMIAAKISFIAGYTLFGLVRHTILKSYFLHSKDLVMDAWG